MIDTNLNLRGAIDLLTCRKISPLTIKTIKEAREISRDDRSGRKWKKGEKYYFLYLRVGVSQDNKESVWKTGKVLVR
jgi:hypothetical protein